MLKMSENLNNKTCGECRFYAKETEHCKLKGIGWKFATDTPCSGFTPRKPITNGDRIRQMDNAETAEFFGFVVSICPPIRGRKSDNCPDGCKECWLNWLNAPAGEDSNAPANAPDMNVATKESER